MASAQHRYGECYLVAQARLVGDQPVRVQGVTAVASPTGREHLAVTIGRVLLYLAQDSRTCRQPQTRMILQWIRLSTGEGEPGCRLDGW